MSPDHPALTEDDVLSHGGWHPRYARVLAVTSDGDCGCALVDGNGDGAELEAEMWKRDSGHWDGAGSFGAGPLDHLAAVPTGGQIGNAYFTYGSAPGHQTITISFDDRRYDVPVGRHGVWAFIKVRTNPRGHDFPSPTA